MEKKTLHNKCIYWITIEHDDSKRYKTRLIVKEFHHKRAIDFYEVFSSIAKIKRIGLILGMVATKNLRLEQLNVKIAFPHGDLEKDIYMHKP